MWVKIPPRLQPAELLQSPVRPIDRHVPHAPAGLNSSAADDHLVIMKERAIEQHGIGAAETLQQISVIAAAPGT